MIENLKTHIDNKLPFLTKKKLCIAVSGGLDSMVLLHLLQKLNFTIAVLHCNFNLRGQESNFDEDFVKNYCNQNMIPIFVANFDTKQFAKTNKLSMQVAARKLRYDWFYHELSSEKCDFVLTAHHLDDSLETFLINLSRGTGLDGLTGIPTINNQIVRPLLPFSRTEIEQYAKNNQISWREDSSNNSDNYLRNKIRHHIVPQLKLLNPDFLLNFSKTQNFLQESDDLLKYEVTKVYHLVVKEISNSFYFDIKILLNYETYKTYLYYWLRPFGFRAWDDIYKLVNAENGKKILSESHQFTKFRNFLILSKLESNAVFEQFEITMDHKSVNFPVGLSFCRSDDIFDNGLNCIFVDENLLTFPLKLRLPKTGDVFFPKGMNGSKKVSKFMKDEKIPPTERDKFWILTNANDAVIWIIGKRQDQRFVANNQTKNILRITYTK